MSYFKLWLAKYRHNSAQRLKDAAYYNQTAKNIKASL